MARVLRGCGDYYIRTRGGPGEVPAAGIKGLEAETDFDKLERWHKLAITATLEKFQQEM